MDFLLYQQDMTIARKALVDSKLNLAVRGTLLCEVYCHSSMGSPSFYLQIYGERDYTILFAKPVVTNRFGVKSGSCLFTEVVATEKHPADKGDIYCGIQMLSEKNPVIENLLGCLPEKDEMAHHPGLVIDGVTTVICNHRQEQMSTLCYCRAKDIRKNQYSEKQESFLENLHRSLYTVIMS